MNMFWKKAQCMVLTIIVLVGMIAAPVQAADTPVILRVSDNATAGDVFNVYGEGLAGDVKLFYTPIEGEDRPVQLHIAQKDSAGHFLTAYLPKEAQAEQFWVWAEVNKSKSNVWVGNQPRPQWLEEPKVMQGQKIRIFGRNLMLADAQPQVRLTGGNAVIYPTVTSANPYAVEILIPEDALTGTYVVEVSLGGGLWFGLSEGTMLEIRAAESRHILFTAETPIVPAQGMLFWESRVYGDYVYTLTDGTYKGLRVFHTKDTITDVTPEDVDLQFAPCVAGVGSMLIEGDVLYVLDWESPCHLRQYSLENPAAPELISKHNLQVVSTPRDMALDNGIMYIAACGGVVAVQTEQTNSDSSWKTGYDANMLSCTLDNGKLYCTAFCEGDQKSYLYVHRIQADGTIANVAKRGFDGFERIADVEVIDGYAYLGMRNENTDPWNSKLGILAVDGVQTQEALDAAQFSTSDAVPQRISQFSEMQGYLLVTTLDGNTYCLDVAAPTTPVVKSIIESSIANWSINTHNGKVYLGNTETGIRIYTMEISDVATKATVALADDTAKTEIIIALNQETSVVPAQGMTFWESCVYGDYVYTLTDGAYQGLRVFQLTDAITDVTPADADLQFSPCIAGVGSMLIDGNVLYVLDWENPCHLRQYSLENPAAPELISKHNLQAVSTPRDMALDNGIMYIAACGGVVSVQTEQTNSDSSWKTGYDANMLSCTLDNGQFYCTAFCEGDQKSYLYVHSVEDGVVTNIGKRGFDGFERIADVEVIDGYAYLGMRNENTDPWNSKLGILAVNGVQTQEALDTAQFSTSDAVPQRISQFAQMEEYLFVATLDGDVYCLDVAVPTEPLEKAKVSSGMPNWSMHAGNNKIYLGNTDAGISIYTMQKSAQILPDDVPSAPAQDPLNLGVWWAGEFRWDNQFTPDIPNPEQATGAIQGAIDSAYQAGGGVVNIPAGTFTVSNLVLRNGVVVRGAGKEETIIQSDASSWAIFRNEWDDTGNRGLQGVCDLTITLKDMENAPYYPDFAIYFTGGDIFEKVFVKNCKTVLPMDMRWNGQYGESSSNLQNPKLSDDGRSIAVYSGKVKHVLLDHCDFQGYMGAPYLIGDVRYVKMSDCTMRINAGNAHLVGVHVVAENNTIQIEKERDNPYDWNSEGIITRGPSYVAKNRIDGAGKTGHNDGEAILVENAGSYTKMLGNVTGAGAEFIRVDAARYIRNWDLSDNAWGDWHVVIIDGKGLGQYRKIRSLDGQKTTIYVDEAWDVIPDNTSKYAVVLPIIGVTVYQNTITNSSKGIWFYNNTIDGVIDGNYMDNTSGCYSNSIDLGGAGDLTVSYYNQMINNTVRGVSEKTHVSGIGESAILWVDTDAYAYLIYGSELRANELDGNEKQEQVVPYVLESPDINGVYMGHAVRVETLSRPVVKGGIIAGNTIKNSDRGITVGGGLYPETWFHKDSVNVRGTTGITLANNRFANTQLPYHYQLASANLPLSEVVRASDTIGVSPDVDLYINGIRTQTLDKGKLQIQATIRNISPETAGLKMIAAVYAQNQLQDVQITDVPALASQEARPVTVNVDLTGYDTITDKKVKCFIWSNDGIIPLLDEAYQKEG